MKKKYVDNMISMYEDELHTNSIFITETLVMKDMHTALMIRAERFEANGVFIQPPIEGLNLIMFEVFCSFDDWYTIACINTCELNRISRKYGGIRKRV